MAPAPHEEFGQGWTLLPQIVFEESGPKLLADLNQINEVGGPIRFWNVFSRVAKEAFYRYEARSDPREVRGLWIERIPRKDVEGFRYPPRCRG